MPVTADLSVGNNLAWANNSGNLFTVSGNVALSGNTLTVNGTGNTLVSGVISGIVSGGTLIKEGSGTLTLPGIIPTAVEQP